MLVNNLELLTFKSLNLLCLEVNLIEMNVVIKKQELLWMSMSMAIMNLELDTILDLVADQVFRVFTLIVSNRYINGIYEPDNWFHLVLWYLN